MDDDLRQLSDTELMTLVKSGSFAAFDVLYERYSTQVRRFLFSLTWDQDTAEDCLQEVFLRLYRARHSYEPTAKFSTYVLQIAKNYYISQCRRKKLECRETSLSDGTSPFEHIRANPRVEPEVHLMEGYMRFRIRRRIAELPEAQKLVFVMSHFEGMKQTEIAEVLGVPVGTVKSRMFAAVTSLRNALKEELK